jgi:hypothetical protein
MLQAVALVPSNWKNVYTYLTTCKRQYKTLGITKKTANPRNENSSNPTTEKILKLMTDDINSFLKLNTGWSMDQNKRELT